MELDMKQLMYDLNKMEALRRLPVILFLAVLAIVGIASNLHVWFIYKCHFKSSTYRVFVLFMAMIDIVCCFVTIPFEIVDELFPFAYTELISCKIFRFVGTCITIASVFMLVVISIERYGKVCKSDGNLMSETSATFSSTVVLIASVVFTFPAIYVYGRKTITKSAEIDYYGNITTNDSVIGYDCTWGDNIEETLYFRFYHVWILMTVIGCMVMLIVIYSLILSTIRRNIILTRRYSECQTGPLTAGSKNINIHQGDLDQVSSYTNDREHGGKDASTITNIKIDGDTDGKLEKENIKQNGDDALAMHINVDDNVATQSKKSREIIKDQKCSYEYHYSAKEQLLREKLRHATTINERELPVTKVMLALSLLFMVSCLPHVVCIIVHLSDAFYTVSMPTP
ncbi:cholecystokinin receptor type A-like [Pecten maximus]|uniref:cholecystokinin receptor type A-like n=1 Tax=Pecten maximus TaxID=6579 RepID=UPI001458FC9C|nr:cholecystokinin receptor type A-like [Pecten maximus]